MNYYKLQIEVKDELTSEILVARLCDLPFESFEEQKNLLNAYVPQSCFDEVREGAEEVMREMDLIYRWETIPERNWNEVWESNFEPVDVDGKCMVRAPFHSGPADGLDIVIMPKMSFGTGHHSTTRLMLRSMLDRDFRGLRGLDIGSGTGVLAIAAIKMGAGDMYAVDIDEWAYENSIENAKANRVLDNLTVIKGEMSSVAGKTFDFILANINRNILLESMESYYASLKKGGIITMSGILEEDEAVLRACAERTGFAFIRKFGENGWAALEFQK